MYVRLYNMAFNTNNYDDGDDDDNTIRITIIIIGVFCLVTQLFNPHFDHQLRQHE